MRKLVRWRGVAGMSWPVLGLKHSKAVGTPAGLVNRLLEELHFEPTTVYEARKKYNRPKRWHPKRRIEEAIQAVENMEAP